jgi:hypothetical protein
MVPCFPRSTCPDNDARTAENCPDRFKFVINAELPFDDGVSVWTPQEHLRRTVMHRDIVGRYDWRRAEYFDPSVLMTISIGIVVATALAILA